MQHGFFQSSRLGVGAVQDHEIVKIGGQARLRGQYFFYFSGDEHTLLRFVGGLNYFYFSALIAAGPQFFFRFVDVFLYDRVSRVQNILGAAVIFFQKNYLGLGVVFFKGENIPKVGPAESVNRLPVVAHHADVFVFLRQQFQKNILGAVGVLVFVHQNIAELVLVFFQNIGKFLE